MKKSVTVSELSDLNETFVSTFSGKDIPGKAGKGLLILTCMDSRIIPHEIFGL